MPSQKAYAEKSEEGDGEDDTYYGADYDARAGAVRCCG